MNTCCRGGWMDILLFGSPFHLSALVHRKLTYHHSHSPHLWHSKLLVHITYLYTIIFISGNVFSYVRLCSNGSNFSPGIRKLERITNQLRPDNQTLFEPNDQGYLFYVTLCDSDFCNGPKPESAATNLSAKIVLLFISVFIPQLILWSKWNSYLWEITFQTTNVF